MRILILGGTGSGGRSLIRHLRGLSPQAHLTVVSRTATSLPGVARVLTGHYADLIALPDTRRQLSGLDAVVHLADGLSVLQYAPHAADEGLAERLTAASEALAAAVRDARVPLFVHVSSIKALCDEADERVLVETSAPRATTLYGRAKMRLEQRLSRALDNSDTRLVTVRNPVMYGGAKPGSMSRLLRLADTPLPLPLAGVANRRSLLAIDNFGSALAAIVAAGPNGAAGTFHVHDGPALSTTEIVETLRRLYGSLELSDARFRRCFNWTPVVDSREALSRMAGAAVGRG